MSTTVPFEFKLAALKGDERAAAFKIAAEFLRRASGDGVDAAIEWWNKKKTVFKTETLPTPAAVPTVIPPNGASQLKPVSIPGQNEVERNVRNIASIVDMLTQEFFHLRDVVPQSITSADLQLASKYATEFANVFNSLSNKDDIYTLFFKSTNEKIMWANPEKAQPKQYFIGVLGDAGTEQTDGNKERSKASSFSIASKNGIKSEKLFVGERFYFLLAYLILLMKFTNAVLENQDKKTLPNVQEQIYAASGRTGTGRNITYSPGDIAMTAYKQLLNITTGKSVKYTLIKKPQNLGMVFDV